MVVGDVIVTWDGTHTITGWEAHPGHVDDRGTRHPARIALSGDWYMTVFDDDRIEMVVRQPDPQREKLAGFLDGLVGKGGSDR